MAFSTPALTSANWPYHEDLRALRLSALHRLAMAGIVIGCIWYLYLAIGIELVSLRAWSGALVLVASSLVAYWIGERWDLTAAASVLVSGVAGSDAGWVVTGRGGVIFSSPDTLAWTPRASGTTNWIFRVRWLGDRFVAVGQNGTLLTSPDGLAWTPRATGTTAWLNDVLFLAGRYFVCGTQGTLLTSTNASEWTALEGITGKSLYGLAGRGFQLVSVGVEGIILRAPLEPLPPAQILGYEHRECPDARVDRFHLGGTVDQRVALEVSEDLRTWRRVDAFEFYNSRLEPELIRTNAPPARAEFFRLIPAAP